MSERRPAVFLCCLTTYQIQSEIVFSIPKIISLAATLKTEEIESATAKRIEEIRNGFVHLKLNYVCEQKGCFGEHVFNN